MVTDEMVKKALFNLADTQLRQSLEQAGRESESEVNKLLEPLGKRAHILLTVRYEDLPASTQQEEKPTQFTVEDCYKETKG